MERAAAATGQPGRSAAEALGREVLIVLDVADRKVRKVDLVRRPVRFAYAERWRQRAPEKRQFEPEVSPIVRIQVADKIPPLRLKVRVRAMILGELQHAHMVGARIASRAVVGLQRNHARAKRRLCRLDRKQQRDAD